MYLLLLSLFQMYISEYLGAFSASRIATMTTFTLLVNPGAISRETFSLETVWGIKGGHLDNPGCQQWWQNCKVHSSRLPSHKVQLQIINEYTRIDHQGAHKSSSLHSHFSGLRQRLVR